MALALTTHFDEVISRLASANKCLIGLDFDGTLTPIVEDRRSATLTRESREQLSRIAAQATTSVAIISGRSLYDLQARVNIARIIYAGNHGLDILGPDLRYVEPAAVRQAPKMANLARILRVQLSSIAGADVEDKGLTLSVHFRRADPAKEDLIRNIVYSSMSDSASNVRITTGHKVFELRPESTWHKGHALTLIRDHLNCHEEDVLYVGDDQTDEDAFEALPDAMTIRVGTGVTTSAKYIAHSIADVWNLLARIEGVCAEE